MLSKKHYKAIAEIIKNATLRTDPLLISRGDLMRDLCAYFKGDNPNFDSYRFARASNIREAICDT